MPIQTPQWTDFLICPVCENGFELKTRLPISLACGHSICKTCLANLQRNVCPFDQVIVITLTKVIMKSDNKTKIVMLPLMVVWYLCTMKIIVITLTNAVMKLNDD